MTYNLIAVFQKFADFYKAPAQKLPPAPPAFLTRPPNEDEQIRKFLQGKQIVLVNGYWGGDFSDNLKELRRIDPGIPFTKINPAPAQSIAENAELLISLLKKASRANPSRAQIILIGHSKGGAEVVHLAVYHSEIFDSSNGLGFQVDQVLTLQAALGGSIVADIELRNDLELFSSWRQFLVSKNIKVPWWALHIKGLLLGIKTPGFQSLSTLQSKERNSELVHFFSSLPLKIQQKIKSHIHFNVSYRKAENFSSLPFYLRTMAEFIDSQGSPNDGLLKLEHQSLAEVGNILITAEDRSHFNLIEKYGPAKIRQDFTFEMLLRLSEKLKDSSRLQ